MGKRMRHITALLSVLAAFFSMSATAQELEKEDSILTVQNPYRRIRLYRPDRGPTRNLGWLDNSSCAPIPEIDRQVEEFISTYAMAGASLAVMRNDSLLYVKGYGLADRENRIPMQPRNVMRIASTSKLITAIGIMKLQEQGILKLSDKVFGPEGILGQEDYASKIYDPAAKKITVEDLLRHKGGFGQRGGDPMFRTGAVDGKEVVRKELSKRLAFTPGTSQRYSNVGYYILSLVIEKVTGEKYEKWMQENILRPSQCYAFRIAGNYPEQRGWNEARYYMHPGSQLCSDYHADGKMREACYGGNNVSGLLGAGGWVASAPELCRLVAGIDYDLGIWDLLSERSVDDMTEYFDPQTYSLGWNDTSQRGVWTRTGSFSGTTAIIKYFTLDGDCWVLLTNTSTWLGPRIASRTSAMIRRMREKYINLLPTDRNLFYDE